jgi:hypothetical protein
MMGGMLPIPFVPEQGSLLATNNFFCLQRLAGRCPIRAVTLPRQKIRDFVPRQKQQNKQDQRP